MKKKKRAWETVADFTAIKKESVPVRDVLKALRKLNVTIDRRKESTYEKL